MTSLKFPDTGTRLVVLPSGAPAANRVGTLYADKAMTQLAEVYLDVNGVKGALIADGKITLDAYGQQPDYWGPANATDRLFITVNIGPAVPVDADYNARIDSVETSVSGAATAAALAAHEADTTAVHGIADTGQLVVTTDVRLSRPGNRLVTWGDSTIAGASQQSSYYTSDCAATYAALLSGQRINLVANAGVGGNTSAQALARFSTDVAPYSPRLVDIGVGTNDTGLSVPLATYQANVAAMVAAVRGIGAMPALRAIPPNNTSGRHAAINLWNAWLRRYASQNGLPYLDAYSTLVDPTNGNYQASLTSDGTHPTTAGYLALGAMYHATLSPLLPPVTPYLSADNADGAAMWTTNNLLITDTNADGVPDGWIAYGGSSGFAHALVTDSAVPGKMMQITQTANASIRILEKSVTGGISVGDILAISGVVTMDGGVNAELKLAFTGGAGSARTVTTPGAAVTRGALYMERPVPTGTTGIIVDCIAGAGTGVCAWGRITVLNLTTGAIL